MTVNRLIAEQIGREIGKNFRDSRQKSVFSNQIWSAEVGGSGAGGYTSSANIPDN